MGSKTIESGGILSIGEAVDRLQIDYPDLSISKVRYLEDEGLLKLARTKGGYRQFSNEDVSRLAEILRLQKEQFLPLTIIKERMSSWTAGKSVAIKDGKRPGNSEDETEGGPVPLSEALKETGTSVDTIKTLENFGLIKLIDEGDGLMVGIEDIVVLGAFARLSDFGIEPRHLRMYENQAHKESQLFQQILSPHLKHKSEKVRRQSRQDLKELLGLTEKLKRAILEKALRELRLT